MKNIDCVLAGFVLIGAYACSSEFPAGIGPSSSGGRGGSPTGGTGPAVGGAGGGGSGASGGAGGSATGAGGSHASGGSGGSGAGGGSDGGVGGRVAAGGATGGAGGGTGDGGVTTGGVAGGGGSDASTAISTDGDAGSQAWGTCGDDYLMCGCGCCGDVSDSTALRCYYASAGETVATAQAADLALKNSSNCALVGCSLGINYVCCADTPAESGSDATYRATYGASDPEEIYITKQGTNVYAELILIRNATSPKEGFALDLPSGWSVSLACNLKSAWSGLPMNVFGAHGTLTFRPSGADCVLDLHATVFSTTVGTTAPSDTSGRLDVDGLLIEGGPASLCGAVADNLDGGLPDTGAPDTVDAPATCTSGGNPPFYCVTGSASGYPDNTCSDSGPNPTCSGGIWTCPLGAIPNTQCGCFAGPGISSQCVCKDRRWICPGAGVDANVGDVP